MEDQQDERHPAKVLEQGGQARAPQFDLPGERKDEKDAPLPVLRDGGPSRLQVILKLCREAKLAAWFDEQGERLQSRAQGLARDIGFLCQPS